MHFNIKLLFLSTLFPVLLRCNKNIIQTEGVQSVDLIHIPCKMITSRGLANASIMTCRYVKVTNVCIIPCAAAAAKLLQSCPTLCDLVDGSPPGSRPRDSPGKNTGVGCHLGIAPSCPLVAKSCLILPCPPPQLRANFIMLFLFV